MKAIILAAGEGTRLKPRTNNAPKCLTEINGISIMGNTLEILEKCKIKETIIVIRHLGNKIEGTFGDKYKSMKLVYEENSIWDKTNNIYSLLLAEKHMNEDILIIEADIFFEYRIMEKLLNSPFINAAVVDHYMSLLEGCVVSLSEDGLINKMYKKSEQLNDFDYSDKYKTVNLYKISKSLVNRMLCYIRNMDVNSFYEESFECIIKKEGYEKLFMKGVIVKGLKWIEIDTLDDIDMAEKVFKSKTDGNRIYK